MSFSLIAMGAIGFSVGHFTTSYRGSNLAESVYLSFAGGMLYFCCLAGGNLIIETITTAVGT